MSVILQYIACISPARNFWERPLVVRILHFLLLIPPFPEPSIIRPIIIRGNMADVERREFIVATANKEVPNRVTEEYSNTAAENKMFAISYEGEKSKDSLLLSTFVGYKHNRKLFLRC